VEVVRRKADDEEGGVAYWALGKVLLGLLERHFCG
jgi:hypothetical protein